MAAPSSVLALVPSEARKDASIITTKSVERHLGQLYDKSIKINILVTAKQIDKLNGFFSPFVFEMSEEATIPQSHLYPKVAEYVGRRLMNSIIAEGALEVGGDVKSGRIHHTCSIRTGRDDSRANANRIDPYAALHGDDNLCKRGAAACAERSNALYANQVYLSQNEVVDIMIAKNARVFHLCIIMTPGVLFGGNHVDDDREITTEVFDGHAHMTFPEGGSGYRHKLSDWQDWHRLNLIKRKGRFFHSELVNVADWVHYYRVTEVFTPDVFTHQINTIGHGCVAVPDLLKHFDDVMHMSRKKLGLYSHADWFSFYSSMRKILIPSEVFESIISYAHGRDDKHISRQGIAHMLRVEQYVVKVGHTTLKMGFRLAGNDFTSVLTTMSFFVLAQRAITTSTLGTLISSLKDDSSYGFFSELWADFLRLMRNKDYALEVPIGSAKFSRVAKSILKLCSFLYEPMKNQVEEQINYNQLPDGDVPVAASWEQSMPTGICFEAAVSKIKHGTMKLASLYSYDESLGFQENLDKNDIGDAPVVSRDEHIFLTHTLEDSCRHNTTRYRRYPYEDVTEAPDLAIFKRSSPGIASTSTVMKAKCMIDLINTQTPNEQFRQLLESCSSSTLGVGSFGFTLKLPLTRFKRKAVFRSSIALLCGPPYADCAVFTQAFRKVYVNDYSNVGSHIFPPGVHRLRMRNLLCDDCLGTDMHIVYADLGLDATDFNKLRSTQLQAIITLRKSGKFFTLKLQAGENLFAFGPHHAQIHQRISGLYWYSTNQEASEVWVNNMGLGRKIPVQGVIPRLGFSTNGKVTQPKPKCDEAHAVFLPKEDKPLHFKPANRPKFEWQNEETKANVEYIYPRAEEKPTRLKWKNPDPSAPDWEMHFEDGFDLGVLWGEVVKPIPSAPIMQQVAGLKGKRKAARPSWQCARPNLKGSPGWPSTKSFPQDPPIIAPNVVGAQLASTIKAQVVPAPPKIDVVNTLPKVTVICSITTEPEPEVMQAPVAEPVPHSPQVEEQAIIEDSPLPSPTLAIVPEPMEKEESIRAWLNELPKPPVAESSEERGLDKPKQKSKAGDSYKRAMRRARKDKSNNLHTLPEEVTPVIGKGSENPNQAAQNVQQSGSDVVVEEVTYPVVKEQSEKVDWADVASYTSTVASNQQESKGKESGPLKPVPTRSCEPKEKEGESPPTPLELTAHDDAAVVLQEAPRMILDKVPKLVLEKQVPADGDCLFHCFSYFCGKSADELRKLLMPERGGWGGDEQIARFAHHFGCTVVLTQPQQGAQQFGDQGKTYYIHLEDHHFNIYKPIPKKNTGRPEVLIVPSQKYRAGSLVVEATGSGALKFVGNGTQSDVQEWKKMVRAFRAVFAPIKMEIGKAIPPPLRMALLNDYEDWNGTAELSHRVFEPDMLAVSSSKHIRVLREAGVGATLEGEVVHKSSNGCWFHYKKVKGSWHALQIALAQKKGEKITIDSATLREALHKLGNTSHDASFVVRNLSPTDMTLFTKVVAHTGKHKKLSFQVLTDCKVCYASQFMASGIVGKTCKVAPPKPTVSKVAFTSPQLEAGVADLQRSLKTDKDVFKEVHESAIKNLDDIDCSQDIEVLVEGLRGVAGCGKTTIVRQQIQTKGTIVVCPFSPLTKTYRDMGYRACTIGAFIASNHGKTFETVLLDEVFAMHPALIAYISSCLHAKRIFAIGDADQMEYGGKEQNQEFVMSKFLSIQAYANVSHSVPLDVVVMLNESGINTSIRCNSAVTNSVSLTTVAPVGCENVPTFVTTTAAKGYSKFKTLASAQGMRHPEVLLYAEQSGLQLLKSNTRMLYVGLTRHTEKLHLICSEEARNALQLDFPDLSKHTCIKKGQLRKPVGNYALLAQYEEQEQQDDYDDNSLPSWLHEEFHAPVSSDRTLMGEAQEEDPIFTVIGKELKERALGPTYERILFSEEIMQTGDSKPVKVQRGDEEITVAINEQVYATLVAFGLPLYDLKAPKVYTRPHNPKFDWHKPDCHLDCQQIEKILQGVAPTLQGHNNPFQGLLPTTLPRTQGIMRLLFGGHKSGSLFDIDERPRLAFTIPCQKRGRPFSSSHSLQSAHAFASRCGTPSLKLTEDEANMLAWRMLDAFDGAVNQVSPITSDDLVDGIACMMDAIARRKGEGQVSGLDFRQHRSAKIKAFLKTQTKADCKFESWLRVVESSAPHITGEFDMKAGQTISAQSKAMNLLTGGIIRAIEKNVVQDMKRHIVFCQGQAPRSLKRLIKRSEAHLSPIAFECDITQQDALRGEWCNKKVMLEIYKKYAPAWIDPLILQEALNEYWVAANQAFSLGVYEHFQSGRSDTLFSNTLVNLLLILSVVDVKEPSFIGVQGDDIAVFCQQATPEIPDFLQASLKYQQVTVPSLVGYFVGETLTLDVVRMAIKLVNRQFELPLQFNRKSQVWFRNTTQLTQYQDAVKAWLSVLEDDKDLACTVAYNAEHYNIPKHHAEALLGFLAAFAYSSVKDVVHILELRVTRPLVF